MIRDVRPRACTACIGMLLHDARMVFGESKGVRPARGVVLATSRRS